MTRHGHATRKILNESAVPMSSRAGAAAALRALPRMEKLLGQKQGAAQHLQAQLEAEIKGYLWFAEAHR
jgi:hypothetical protein